MSSGFGLPIAEGAKARELCSPPALADQRQTASGRAERRDDPARDNCLDLGAHFPQPEKASPPEQAVLRPSPPTSVISAAPGSAVRAAQRSSAAARPKIKWLFVGGVVVYHLLALLAFVPWFFSWTGVVVCLLGCYVFGTLGINIGFHRLLTHRGFRCPKSLEHALVLLGICTLQEAPAYWVAIHRRHHQFADDEPDPHSPIVSFLWAHVGWLCVEKPGEEREALSARYAADVLRDPLYRWLHTHGWYVVVALSWLAFFIAGYAVALLGGGTTAEALRFGASLLLWGVIVRTVLVWHITWSVNSVTHLWGYRSYETSDHSQNNVLVGLISNGEGWHNNHHADPTSARHGHQWWELDVAYLTIRLFAALGLARDVALPRRGTGAHKS